MRKPACHCNAAYNLNFNGGGYYYNNNATELLHQTPHVKPNTNNIFNENVQSSVRVNTSHGNPTNNLFGSNNVQSSTRGNFTVAAASTSKECRMRAECNTVNNDSTNEDADDDDDEVNSIFGNYSSSSSSAGSDENEDDQISSESGSDIDEEDESEDDDESDLTIRTRQYLHQYREYPDIRSAQDVSYICKFKNLHELEQMTASGPFMNKFN